jgi:hypothetical protein
MTESELEALFATGRSRPVPPSEALLARVMDDAMAEAGARAGLGAGPVRGQDRRGRLAALLAVIGGWPAMGGLVAAGLVGVWIGYAAPGGLDTVRSDVLGSGYEITDLVPSLDSYLDSDLAEG